MYPLRCVLNMTSHLLLCGQGELVVFVGGSFFPIESAGDPAGIWGFEHSEKDKDSRGYTGESTGRQGRVGREQALYSSLL